MTRLKMFLSYPQVKTWQGFMVCYTGLMVVGCGKLDLTR